MTGAENVNKINNKQVFGLQHCGHDHLLTANLLIKGKTTESLLSVMSQGFIHLFIFIFSHGLQRNIPANQILVGYGIAHANSTLLCQWV